VAVVADVHAGVELVRLWPDATAVTLGGELVATGLMRAGRRPRRR
jgi:hypothetical protein